MVFLFDSICWTLPEFFSIGWLDIRGNEIQIQTRREERSENDGYVRLDVFVFEEDQRIAGNSIFTVVPTPISLSIIITPLCCSTTRLAIERPRPLPFSSPPLELFVL